MKIVLSIILALVSNICLAQSTEQSSKDAEILTTASRLLVGANISYSNLKIGQARIGATLGLLAAKGLEALKKEGHDIDSKVIFFTINSGKAQAGMQCLFYIDKTEKQASIYNCKNVQSENKLEIQSAI